MKCTKCDHELNSDAVFCPMCGTPVAGEKDSIADDIDDEALEPTVLLSDVQDEIAPTVLLTPEELEKSSALAAAFFTDEAVDAAMQQPAGEDSPASETQAEEAEITETEMPKKAGISPVIPIAAIVIILIIIIFF